MTAQELGYLAGIIDGEANISIRRIKSGHSFYIYMNVSNTSEELLKYLMKITSMGYINGPFKNKGDNRRPYWKWHVPQAELLAALIFIRPMLIVKSKIVSLAFAMRELQSANWRTTSPDILAARERIFAEAKEINRRGFREKRSEFGGSPERIIPSEVDRDIETCDGQA